jgi:hypothetical protein
VENQRLRRCTLQRDAWRYILPDAEPGAQIRIQRNLQNPATVGDIEESDIAVITAFVVKF